MIYIRDEVRKSAMHELQTGVMMSQQMKDEVQRLRPKEAKKFWKMWKSRDFENAKFFLERKGFTR